MSIDQEKFKRAWLKIRPLVRLIATLAAAVFVCIAFGKNSSLNNTKQWYELLGAGFFVFIMMAIGFNVMAYFVAGWFLVTFQDITNSLANIQKSASNRLSAAIQGFLNGLKAGFSKPYHLIYNIVYVEWHGGVFESMVAGGIFGLMFGIPFSLIGGILGFFQGLLLGDPEFK